MALILLTSRFLSVIFPPLFFFNLPTELPASGLSVFRVMLGQQFGRAEKLIFLPDSLK
jgi:hypothetical protein